MHTDKQQQPMQAISYTRFSSDIQKDGSTILRQNARVQQYLDDHPNVTLVREYSDDGVSAFAGDHLKENGGLWSLIRDAEKGIYPQGTILLCEALDRLSREGTRKTSKLIDRILSTGLSMVLLQDNPDKIYTEADLDDELTTITIAIKAGMAAEESRKKSSRGTDNWERKRKEAAESGLVMTKACPSWLRVREDRKGFEAHAVNWSTVQKIFRLRLEGMSMAAIAAQLNDELTPNFKGDTTGKWNQSSIQQLLVNPAVHGQKVISRKATKEVKLSAQPIDGYYTVNQKAPVSLADFQKVQSMSSEFSPGKKPANTSPNMINIFKGVLVCGLCGATMIMNSVTSKKHGYYVCSMRRLKRCPESRPMRRDLVDASIIQGVMYNIDRLLTGNGEQEKELEQMTAERFQLEQRRVMLTDLLLDMRISREDYNKRYDQLGTQVDQLDHQIAILKSKMNSERVSHRVANMLLDTAAERHEVQMIAKAVFDRIALYGGSGDGRKGDTGSKTADIYLKAGYELINYPVDRVIDGANWIETLHITGETSYTFDGTEKGLPLHVQMKNAPDWVKDAIEDESHITSVRTS